MSRAALAAWGIAILLLVGIGVQSVRAHGAKCERPSKKTCAAARAQEYRTLLMGGLSALVIGIATPLAVVLARDR